MQDKNFISYEYKTITVKAQNQARAADMYEAFGWEITSVSAGLVGSITMSLKRDRKQPHKQELVRLERQAEAAFDTADKLEQSKTLAAKIFCYTLGIIAALMLGGGMCLVMLVQNSVVAFAGGIVLGLAGIALCAVNYLIYKKLVERKLKRVLPLIDENEEKLADLLERGNDLLVADII